MKYFLVLLLSEYFLHDKISNFDILNFGAGPEILSDAELMAVLDQFDGREVLHVTFGSVLERFGSELLPVLDGHEDAYYAALKVHFERHLAPFVK